MRTSRSHVGSGTIIIATTAMTRRARTSSAAPSLPFSALFPSTTADDTRTKKNRGEEDRRNLVCSLLGLGYHVDVRLLRLARPRDEQPVRQSSAAAPPDRDRTLGRRA